MKGHCSPTMDIIDSVIEEHSVVSGIRQDARNFVRIDTGLVRHEERNEESYESHANIN